jgi:hypothetical protein
MRKPRHRAMGHDLWCCGLTRSEWNEISRPISEKRLLELISKARKYLDFDGHDNIIRRADERFEQLLANFAKE